MANLQTKFMLLYDIAEDRAFLNSVPDKLLLVPDKYESRVARYDKDLKNYEIRYGISSGSFYEKFEAGKMGDAADFFEWSGLVDLRNDLMKKLSRPESV